MKSNFIIVILIFFALAVRSQDNSLLFSAGYAFTTIEDIDVTANGWRINGQYTIHPRIGNLLHGFTVGYNRVYTTIEEMSGPDIIESKYSISTLPFYYSPKLLIGEGTLKGFIKGAFGMQFSTLKRTGDLDDFTSNDAGLFAGFGVGAMKLLENYKYINLEYEWGYASNSYYNDGFLHSITLGLGISVQ